MNARVHVRNDDCLPMMVAVETEETLFHIFCYIVQNAGLDEAQAGWNQDYREKYQ